MIIGEHLHGGSEPPCSRPAVPAFEALEPRLLLSTQVVFGTEADDVIQLSIGAESFTVTVNGQTSELPFRNGRALKIQGLGGNDRVDIIGGLSRESLSLWPTRGTLSAGGRNHYKVLLEGLESIHFSGQNEKTLKLYGSAGDDKFIAGPLEGSMTGAGYSNWASGFGHVYGYAVAGGVDVATFTDSAGDDEFAGNPSAARLSGEGFYSRASHFQQVYARALEGGTDTSTVSGSRSSDSLSAADNWVRLAGATYNIELVGFDSTRVGGGRKDVAYLDTNGVTSALLTRKGKTTLTTSDQQVITSGFRDLRTALPAEELVEVAPQVLLSQPAASGDGLAGTVGGAQGACTWIDLPYTFLLSLGRAASVRRIEFTWDSTGAFPTFYQITLVDSLATLDSVPIIATPTRLNVPGQAFQVLDFSDQPLQAAYLRIMITGGASGTLAGLRNMRILADQPTPIESILMDPANAATLLGSQDHANPLWIMGEAIPVSVQKVAEYALQGLGALTDFQKTVVFMHLFDTAQGGTPSTPGPVPMLLENIGVCGNFANTLLALTTAVGIPGRLVNLSNYPKDNGHTVTELYIDGRWSLFDPTFGMYFTTDPDNTVNPYVLSFDDLHAGRGDDPDVTRVVGNPQRLALWGDNDYSFSSPQAYVLADPAGPIGPDRPMVFPLWLDLATKPSIGVADFGPFNQGSFFLGGAFFNASQEFTLSGLTPGQQYTLTIVYSNAGGYPGDRTTFDATSEIISGGTMISGDSYQYLVWESNDPWTITFSAADTQVDLLLTHNYLDYFYISASSYTLSSV